MGKAVNTRQSNVTQNGEVQNQALCFAVFGYEAQSCLNSILRLGNLQRLALENQLAACMRINAENGAHDFGTAAAHKAGKAQNLALAQVKVNIMENSRLFKVLNLQQHLARLIAAVGIKFRNGASYHIVDNLLHAVFLNRLGCNGYAVTHNGNRVAVLRNLFHTVRNIHHCYTTFFQGAHNLKELFCFSFGQRRRRLVHNNNLGIQQKVTDDFRHLLLSYRAFAGFHIQWQLNFNFTAFLLCHSPHSLKIQDTHAVGYAVHQKQVFQNAQVRPDIQLLMDEGDAVSFCLQRIFEADFLAVDKNLSLILLVNTRQDIHQC